MQFSGFLLHKRLFCLDHLRSCSVQANDELAVLASDQYRISNMEPSSLQPLPHQTNRRNRLVVVPAQRTNLQFSFVLACYVFVLLFQSTILA